MIRSLKEDSAKYAREREVAARNRRLPGKYGQSVVCATELISIVPYATVRDQTRYGGDEMMIDEPDDRDRYPSRHVEETRLRNAPPVSSAYIPESGYTSTPAFYPVATSQTTGSGYDPPHPRYVPGNSTPPGISGRTPGYTGGGYPPVTTRSSIPSIPAAGPFPDSRSNVSREAGYGYPPEPRPRHR